jgi:hypothetical protein
LFEKRLYSMYSYNNNFEKWIPSSPYDTFVRRKKRIKTKSYS